MLHLETDKAVGLVEIVDARVAHFPGFPIDGKAFFERFVDSICATVRQGEKSKQSESEHKGKSFHCKQSPEFSKYPPKVDADAKCDLK
jgi:hypothetical protein